MKVALINSKDSPRGRYLLECMESGCAVHGDECRWIHQEDFDNAPITLAWCDVGIQICFVNKKFELSTSPGKRRQGDFRRMIDDEMKRLCKRLVTIDTGFVKNQTEFEMQVALKEGRHILDFTKPETYKEITCFNLSDPRTYDAVQAEIYYEVGFDGLKRSADYCNSNAPGDRWEKLGVEMKPWRSQPGGYVLFLCQTFHGQSSQMVDIYEHYRHCATELRKSSRLPFLFRHHPRNAKIRGRGTRLDKDRRAIEKVISGFKNWSYSDKPLLADDLEDAALAVCYSSNAGVTAILHGVPLYGCAPIGMAYDCATLHWDTLHPSMPERRPWAYRLAYAQWNCAEMKSGECWSHLRPHAILHKPEKVA